MGNLTVDKYPEKKKYHMKKKSKNRRGKGMKDISVENRLIKRSERKIINVMFLSVSFYPHEKNLKFGIFHN